MDTGTNGNNNEPTPEAARTAGPGGGIGSVSKETPISIATPSYGLQETHTTILPYTGWLSAGNIDKTTPAQLKIRLNAPYDMLDVAIEAALADASGPAAKGFYAHPFDSRSRRSNSAGIGFPDAFSTGATTATEETANQVQEWTNNAARS